MVGLFGNLPAELRSLNSGIYMILNLINGKCYIGSSVNFRVRFNKHTSELNKNRHHCKHLQFAWNKYWSVSFKFKILQLSDDLYNLEKLEQEWIDWLKPEYNVSSVAGSPLGLKRSEETKEKLREAAKNRKPISEETRAKMKASAKVKIFTDNHRLNMGISKKGNSYAKKKSQS